ncbi:MAG: hypothetical protein VW239_00340 [Candidatus Nanopelagicales bacterium]
MRKRNKLTVVLVAVLAVSAVVLNAQRTPAKNSAPTKTGWARVNFAPEPIPVRVINDNGQMRVVLDSKGTSWVDPVTRRKYEVRVSVRKVKER